MSSGIVRVNSHDVRLFASQLKDYNAKLAEESARLTAQFRRLGETWQDPQFAQFAQGFEQTMRNLDRFRRYGEEVIPRLIRLADHIDSTPPV